jgi:hypothetical protein
MISKETHDALTRVELRALIDACERCECPPEMNCYCASNLEWAERKLAAMAPDSSQDRGTR